MKSVLKFASFLCFILVIVTCCKPAANKNQGISVLSDTDLITIRDGFDQRVSDAFTAQQGKPLNRAKIRPPITPGRPNSSQAYSKSLTNYAASCMWLNENIDSANLALVENAKYYLSHTLELYNKDNFHWNSEVVLRLIEMFGKDGTKYPGLLKTETESLMLESVWLYCKRNGFSENYKRVDDSSPIGHDHLSEADHLISNTWYLSESENHHSQSFSTQWHFAKLANSRPGFRDRLYDDGLTVSYHYKQWNDYLKMYFTERAKKGMFIEMMSIGYNTELLKGIFNVYDFAEDEELKRKAGLFLDLYFTYWGEEQINGISGGGKARLYSDILVGTSGYGYYFFGVGNKPGIQSDLLTAMTTTYRPSLVVVDIVCDTKGRGVYEVKQRPLGLVTDSNYFRPALYHMRTDSGGILRYSYCTPDFVMGTPMSEARPYWDWAMISSQNRSHGIIFEGDQAACILPQCENSVNSRAFNSQWSVQQKGTFICQKLNTSWNAGKTRIWVSQNGLSAPIEEKGWYFIESKGAYAAIKIVDGSAYWDTTTTSNRNRAIGKWLYCQKEYSPIILEVVQKSEFKTFQKFREKISDQKLSFENNILKYKGIYGDMFTFYTDYSQSPRINNVTVNYAPAKVFDSPFLISDWNSGIVYIQKDKRKIVLNFNEPS